MELVGRDMGVRAFHSSVPYLNQTVLFGGSYCSGGPYTYYNGACVVTALHPAATLHLLSAVTADVHILTKTATEFSFRKAAPKNLVEAQPKQRSQHSACVVGNTM